MFETEFAIEKNRLFLAGKKIGTGFAFLIFVSAFYFVYSRFHTTELRYFQVLFIGILLYLIYIVSSFIFRK